MLPSAVFTVKLLFVCNLLGENDESFIFSKVSLLITVMELPVSAIIFTGILLMEHFPIIGDFIEVRSKVATWYSKCGGCHKAFEDG